MTALTSDMSSPLPSGFTSGLGGPNTGGHSPPDWFVQLWNGLRRQRGYGSPCCLRCPHKLFMRSPNDKMGGFYTHITDVPAGLGVGSPVSRGDLLGKVHSVADTGAHLHLALARPEDGTPG